MSRNLLFLAAFFLFAASLVLQGLFMSRIQDSATLTLLQQVINQHLEPQDALTLRGGKWKTGWFLTARADALEIVKSGTKNSLTLKYTRFDIDLLPALFKGRMKLEWESREQTSGTALRGVMELGLFDLMPQSNQFQFGPMTMETLLPFLPQRVRSSPWIVGLQGQMQMQGQMWMEGQGNLAKSLIDLEVKQLRWRSSESRLPPANLGQARTQLSYDAGQWSFHPPMIFKDAQTGLELKLDYDQTLRLTIAGPPLVIAVMQQSQRCPGGARIELYWSAQGFICR